MISAASDYAMIDVDESSAHDSHHTSHHHMGPRHKCFIRQTYRWLCHHKELIRVALVVELVLCAVFGMVHLVWSCCITSQQQNEDDSPSDLKAPLIESASAYAPQDERMIISPLWAHVMDSKSNASLV